MSNLTIKIEAQGNITIMKLIGSADMTETQEFDASIDKVLALGCEHIIVDMKSLFFACSMALGSLVKLRKKCYQDKVKLGLLDIQPSLHKVLRTTQLDNLFSIYDTIEDAVKGQEQEETSNE
ncbi:MAG: STAS domain-containing protein [Phycisphaerae bacterium]|nr:STAS domain-containing protein [Phycisphaerae bacterium]